MVLRKIGQIYETIFDGKNYGRKSGTWEAVDNIERMVSKGSIDCSSNPLYPGGKAGEMYVVSASGKIGGSDGLVVSLGDILLRNTTSVGGLQIDDGGYWTHVETGGGGGADGKTIISGTAAPPALSIGNEGDYYLNTLTYILYGPKTSVSWGSGVSLKGSTGSTGAKGDQGDPGPSTTIIGSVDYISELSSFTPTPEVGDGIIVMLETGHEGHLYICTATGPLAFNDVGHIVGPRGIQGEKGDAGSSGSGDIIKIVSNADNTIQLMVMGPQSDVDTVTVAKTINSNPVTVTITRPNANVKYLSLKAAWVSGECTNLQRADVVFPETTGQTVLWKIQRPIGYRYAIDTYGGPTTASTVAVDALGVVTVSIQGLTPNKENAIQLIW